jgi:hypothetical protein
MSTRSTIHFVHHEHPESPEAIVYKHTDGYPDGVWGNKAVLATFFEVVAKHVHDTRFDDSCYLAAKFVVFLTAYYSGRTRPSGANFPLDFLSVGIMRAVPFDVEYTYLVSDRLGSNGRPLVAMVEPRVVPITDLVWEETEGWELNEELLHMFD